MEYCKVKNCRYSTFHTTQRHRCGLCKHLGHGQMECNDIGLKNNLKQSINTVDIPCTVIDCVDNTTHTTEGHDCLYCKSRKGHLKHCPCNGAMICDSGDSNILQNITVEKGHYIIKYAGQGCMWYIRCNQTGLHEYLFMHGDCWGQYGPDTDESPRYNAFIHGYVLQEELY